MIRIITVIIIINSNDNNNNDDNNNDSTVYVARFLENQLDLRRFLTSKSNTQNKI